jgi:hypothetical protein
LLPFQFAKNLFFVFSDVEIAGLLPVFFRLFTAQVVTLTYFSFQQQPACRQAGKKSNKRKCRPCLPAYRQTSRQAGKIIAPRSKPPHGRRILGSLASFYFCLRQISLLCF